MDLLFVALGLVVLFVGGEATLRGAVGLAQALGVTPAVIGLIVVGFGTSAPELVVTLNAALQGTPDLAIGNVVGSNIANILLILGIGGLIYPMTCHPRSAVRDGLAMLLSIGLLCLLGMVGAIVWWNGVIMLVLLAVFIVGSYVHDKRLCRLNDEDLVLDEPDAVPHNNWLIALFLLAGLAGLIGGAHLLVTGATGLARAAGIPESVIGLTLVAVGTSLPELAATIIAAWRKHTELAIANALGSCVFNVLAILGISSMVTPLPIAQDIQNVDMWVMLATSCLFVALLWWERKVSRLEGGAMLALYCIYIGSMGPRVPGF